MTVPEASAMEPETLTALLRHFEWSPRSKVPGLYEVWSPEESDDEEIVVPLDPQRGDYRVLLEKARRSVFVHYGRLARDLSAMLEMRTRAALDSTQWKKETDLDVGIIGWEEGEALYEAARTQLVASAKSTKEARRYHGNASAYVARRFMESSFMGQTDIGSYIITAFTPARERFHISKHSEEIHLSKPRESETLRGREILTTFERALKAVRSGLEDYKRRPQVELFLDTVQEGVSYEFTKALSQITSNGDSEIQITYYSDHGDRQQRAEVTFDAIESPILTRVANTFALHPEPQDVTLFGEVTLLSRSSETSDRVIRLHVEDGADVRKARIRLSAEQYEVAMEAHRQEATLRVSGRLEKEGRLYWLYHADNLAIIPNEETGATRSANIETPGLF